MGSLRKEAVRMFARASMTVKGRFTAGVYFLFTYVAKRGFLDGRAGLHYAAYKAWYSRTIWLLIREQSANKI